MKSTREDVVKEFHKTFTVEIDAEPTVELLQSRRALIKEETEELFSDIDLAISLLEQGKTVPRDVYINMLKELADVQIVLSGTSVALKPLQELEEAFVRVSKSNMSKLGEDGKPIHNEYCKVLKGPKYCKPDLSDLVS